MNYSRLLAEQGDRVLGQYRCDIDQEFLGFTDIYENLAKIIPKHYTVIDFGCAYNPQCVLFHEHKALISVDPGDDLERFTDPNCTFYAMTAQQFITGHIHDFELDTTFAICSYVPDDDARFIVRSCFPNCFVYYPSGYITKFEIAAFKAMARRRHE